MTCHVTCCVESPNVILADSGRAVPKETSSSLQSLHSSQASPTKNAGNEKNCNTFGLNKTNDNLKAQDSAKPCSVVFPEHLVCVRRPRAQSGILAMTSQMNEQRRKPRVRPNACATLAQLSASMEEAPWHSCSQTTGLKPPQPRQPIVLDCVGQPARSICVILDCAPPST